MSAKIDTRHIVKLDGTNYQRWKLQITLVLKASDIWDVASGVTAQPAAGDAALDAWLKSDIKAQAIIVPTLDKHQTNHVYNCGTAKAMLDRLKDVNSDASTLNKQHSLSSFLNYRITPDQSILDAYMEIEELARSLDEMGVPMAPATVVTKIVSSLPDEQYQAFKKAWDSVPDASQTMPALLARIRKEELERKQKLKLDKATEKGEKEESKGEQAQAVAYAAKGKPKGKGTDRKTSIQELKKRTNCKNCGKKGHWYRECRSPKQENTEQDGTAWSSTAATKKTANAFMICESSETKLSPDNLWISDSGATQHITGQKFWFENYEEFENPRFVSLTDNKEVKVLGKGKVRLEAFLNGKWTESTVNNVLYIPGAVNLFSEILMAQKGYTIVRDKMQTIFYENGKTVGPVAEYRDSMYVMKFRPIRMSAVFSKHRNAKLWHDRLCHINLQYLRDTVTKNATTGIKLEELSGEISCNECHLGKESRKPFPRIENKRQTKLGEMVHGDLSGKMPIKSLGGSNFFLLLKDDCSGFRCVYFLKHKDETAENIKDFIQFMEKQTGNKVKTFKSDNGTEFINKNLGSYFTEMGILHETTAPYCPESNGRVEREMRTLKDSARSMMQKYSVPQNLWAEAIASTVYIHNRVLDKQSPSITAFEQIFSRKPALDHARCFGSPAFAQVPKEKRLVWDPKGRKSIMVGYDNFSKNYRLYDTEEKRIFISRNVSFSETGEDESVIKLHIKEEQPSSTEDCEAKHEDDSHKPGTSEGGTSQSSKKQDSKTIDVLIETPGGNFTATIPNDGKTSVVIPKPRETGTSDRVLRDRASLKQPERYQANIARVLEEPTSYEEAISSDASSEWKEAMEEEFQSHQKNNTWELVPRPQNTKILDSRWVYKIKQQPDGSVDRYKARLVIKGYKQRYGIDYSETFSSVCRYESIRLLLSIAASRGLKMKQFDIKTAFLYGNLEETVFMTQPEGYEESKELVCHLKKSLYGLRQAPRVWNQTFTQFLSNFNFKPTNSDSCVFIGNYMNELVYLVLYVDDGLVISTTEAAVMFVLDGIREKFEMKIFDPSTFIGIEINRLGEDILLTQTSYIEMLLSKFNMLDCKVSSTPMQPNLDLKPALESEAKIPYRELIGSLIFLARTTRPDIAFATSKLSQFTSNFDESHWKTAKVVLRYLKGTLNVGLLYKFESPQILMGFTDSDYAGDKLERRSTSGFAFFLDDSLISWQSQKQRIVAVSSTEAEYVALAAGAKEALWLRRFLNELGHPQLCPTDILVDNQSAIKLAKNPEYHSRSKHIDVRYHFTRDLIEQKEIEVQYVPTESQAADILTKPLLRKKFTDMKQLLGMAEIDEMENPIRIPARANRICNLNPLNVLGLLLMVMFLFITPGNSFATQNSQPVIWRPSKIPITLGHNRVYLRIRLLNPCDVLNSETLHKDVSEIANAKCTEMYEKLFLDELELMCPKESHQEILLRKKRLISILIMVLVASVVATVGLATAGTTVAAVNSGRISDVYGEMVKQDVAIKDLQTRVDLVEDAVKNLESNFNSLVTRLDDHERDFDELKTKQVSTNFAISYITTRFITAKQIIKETTRQWNEQKMYAPFLDFLNFTLPCGQDCPVSLATARKCYFSEDRKDLYLDFSVPIINRTLHLIEADPFNLMFKENNKTCSVQYTGPTNMVVSSTKNCIFGLNMRQPVKHDLLLAPNHGCMPKADMSTDMKYFNLERCDKEQPFDEWHYVQIKPFHGVNHIYCAGSKLEIEGNSQPCPDNVFILPMSASFKINNMEYQGGQVYLEHKEKIDPLFTLKANIHLQPNVNFSDLRVHPLFTGKSIESTSNESYVNHPMTWVGIICSIISVALIVAFSLFYARSKKYRVSVVARPVDPERQAEAIELQEIKD